MKRNIIKKNKQKNTERLTNKFHYLITKSIYTLDLFNNNKCIKTENFEDAYLRNESSTMIRVPITYTSTVKRSRVKNAYIGSRVFSNIEKYNEKYKLERKLSDIPVKKYF